MIEELPGDIFRRGEILNNTYEIEGVLGRGGTGEVYRARNLISGRIVAIKALNKQFSGNEDYVGLMRREEQMRDVIHDAVVRYSECSRTDKGYVFLVMDYVDGPSVADAMTARRLDPRELMIIAHRVAEGLVAAHGHGIVHRDLSPDNVILRGGNPERATIIDFGIAKDTNAGARTIVGNEFAGKYEYAAPEQLEGRAEVRSDLYGLGALLLAAYRGQVPFSGSTPGEMIRRKQQPLDTAGIPEPLKGLIDWLTQPNAAMRPASAADLVGRLDQLLKPVAARRQSTARGAPVVADGKDGKRSRGGAVWLVVALALLGAGGGGLYAAGVLDRFFVRELPVAAPYVLSADSSAGAAGLAGNAPDADTAVLIRRAYGTAAGEMPPDDALAMARGMPFPGWPQAVTEGLALAAALDGWSLSLSDKSALAAGLAPDKVARGATESALRDWAARYGFDLKMNLATGPRTLPASRVAETLAGLADCGPLRQGAAENESYALGDTVSVTGEVAVEGTIEKLRTALESALGDRGARIEVNVLNPAICKVRAALPPAEAKGASIWLGDPVTGTPSLAGVFTTGQQPAIEVHAPAALNGLSLWVGIVDVTGTVLNVLPNVYSEEDSFDALGRVESGIRKVRVMPIRYESNGKELFFALQVAPDNFGKSEIVAVLTRGDLFAIRRPKDESVDSFLQALDEIRRDNPDAVVAIATRLLDSRP